MTTRRGGERGIGGTLGQRGDMGFLPFVRCSLRRAI